jgi:2-keto-4-pentenoate hydratase/2-oxohepta-3-ene-1,7-dioic acid hydratase in catechol pathway
MPTPDFTSLPVPAIYGIGLNDLSHAREVNKPTPEHPLVFMKPPASATRHGEPILLPKETNLQGIQATHKTMRRHVHHTRTIRDFSG